jgi:ferredoxin-nitrite reductase
VETKERAVRWARWMDEQIAVDPGAGDTTTGDTTTVGAGAADRGRSRRGDDAGVIRMHFSGCSASCAQPQIADIGFRGDTAHLPDRIVEAVDIGMGGSLGADAAFIDWIEGARPVDDVPDALLRVVRRYQAERNGDEPFYGWARRTPNDELRAMLAGLDLHHVGPPEVRP